MKIKEYIESFGWKLEYCSLEEIRQALDEMKSIENGKVVLDSVLSYKPHTPLQQCFYSKYILTPEEIEVVKKIEEAERTRDSFPALEEREMDLAGSALVKAESFFYKIYPKATDEEIPPEGFAAWFVNFF